MVPSLALHLLGPPRFELDGIPIKADTRKAIALLAYIAVTAESHPRAVLINLLWPEYDESRGRAALRRTLYTLNKALAGEWLDTDQDQIGLRPDATAWLDVDQFRQHLAECEAHGHPKDQVCAACASPLAAAVVLYRGDFLTGFGLKDSLNFDDWQFFQADSLRRDLAGALERLVQWHCHQHDFSAAIGYARRQLSLDPLDEQVHRQLMQAYAWSGQRSAALEQYTDCKKVLEDQLGVPPSEETTDLYRAIKEGRAPQAPPAPPPRLAHVPQFEQWDRTELPLFVAREDELAKLERFLDATLTGKGQVTFVTGDAGSGKTALIQEFAQRAQEKHPQLVAASGHCNAHTGVGDPYLPFREVLGLLTGDVETWWAARAITGEQARRLWHLVPVTVQTLVKSGPDLVDLLVPGEPLVERVQAFLPSPSGSVWLTQLKQLVTRRAAGTDAHSLQQSALFEQYSQVLRGLARQMPLLLTLDDLQWADSGSINLLFHLGRQLEGSRILVVGAYRSTEVGLGRPSYAPRTQAVDEQERHPLQPVIHELKRCYGDIEIDLERAEGSQFIDGFLDTEPNSLGQTFRRALYRHTNGYPLFTVELLRGMQDRGDLVQNTEGQWTEGPTLDWETLPARVEAVIATRIARLPQNMRDTLAAASVEGETFTAELVARVRAADEVETVRFLSETVGRRHHLVSAQGVQTVGDQLLSRYRFRHILFQKHLYSNLDPVERIHLHRTLGTMLEELYLSSAKEAPSAEVDPLHLARHFQQAGITRKAIAYLRQVGDKAQQLYANGEAADHYRQALELLDTTSPLEPEMEEHQVIMAEIRESLGDVLEWSVEHDDAQLAYQGALASVPSDDATWQARLHCKLGNLWRMKRRYEDASHAYDRAAAILGTAADDSPEEWWQEWVQIQLERMWLHYWLGQWSNISGLADSVRSIVEQHGTSSQCISFFLSLAAMSDRRDRYIPSAENLSLCQTALAIALDLDNLSEIAWARFMLGFNQLWAGNLDGAEKQMQTALALAERTGDLVHQSRCLTYLTILFRKRGQLEKTRQYVSRSLAAATEGQMQEYVGTAWANLAWLAWRDGDLAEAEEKGQSALDLWQRLPGGHSSCAFQWAALWPLVAVASTRGQSAQACEFLSQILEDTQQRLPDTLEALAARVIKACEDQDIEEAGAYLEQAIELAKDLAYL